MLRKDGSCNMHEVLELVLSCTSDAALLCKATTLSSHLKQVALTRIRLNLPEVLMATLRRAARTVANPYLVKQAPYLAEGPAAWLSAGGGQGVVGQHEVTAALLSPDMVVMATSKTNEERRYGSRYNNTSSHAVWAWKPFLATLAAGGLSRTGADIVLAAKRQLPPLRTCLAMHEPLHCSEWDPRRRKAGGTATEREKKEKENKPGHATSQRAGREGELLRQQQQNVPSKEQGQSKSGR